MRTTSTGHADGHDTPRVMNSIGNARNSIAIPHPARTRDSAPSSPIVIAASISISVPAARSRARTASTSMPRRTSAPQMPSNVSRVAFGFSKNGNTPARPNNSGVTTGVSFPLLSSTMPPAARTHSRSQNSRDSSENNVSTARGHKISGRKNAGGPFARSMMSTRLPPRESNAASIVPPMPPPTMRTSGFIQNAVRRSVNRCKSASRMRLCPAGNMEAVDTSAVGPNTPQS